MATHQPHSRPPDGRRPGLLDVLRTVLQIAQTVVLLMRFMDGC